ncbi:MAG: DNA translocase FtsK 4TM domain-containing protein, partial [Bacteroidales bacterium]|nr:DNA translocase FtsK 4TM domain-containing protein [Bacteroidales bacterium]
MSRFSIDPDLKARILKVTGIVVAFFAIYTLLSCTSYLFHWKADQSVLDSAAAADAENIGGSAGGSWGAFLVCSCLGLGSFALVGLLFMGAWWLFFRKRPVGVVSTVLLVVCGAWLSSIILSIIGPLVGAQNAFGGGLGGRMGAVTVAFTESLVGNVGLIMIVAVLFIIWLLFVCAPFAKWFTTAFEKPEKDAEPDAVDNGELVQTPEYVDDGDVELVAGAQAVGGDAELVGAEYAVQAPVEDTETPRGALAVEPKNGPVNPDPETSEQKKDNGVVIQNGEECVISPDSLNPEDVQEVKIVEATEWPEDVKELERIDNRDELKNFKFPPIDLLSDYSDKIHKVTKAEIEVNNTRIRTTLQSYKIQVDSVTAIVGPTVTLYKVKLAPGMKSSSVKSVEHDIAMALGNESVRVTYLSDAIGIEVANETKSMVPLKAMFNDPAFRDSKFELPIALGYTIEQKVKTFDLADAPHLLVAGATKQGKSVGLNVIVASLLYSKHPSELKMVFIDPKRVEFTAYKRLYHHYLASLPQAASEQDEIDNVIIKDHKGADEVLKSLCIEMDQRYELLSDAGVNKLTDYNEKYKERHLRPDKGHRYLPYLVVVIDEYADLIMSAGSDAKAISKGVTTSIIRLAQKGRAA